MSPWKIAWRSIQQRSLASCLTGLSMALAVTLVVSVLVMQGVINSSFLRAQGFGYNRIVGAKGSKVQLVLNTVYYLSSPVENLPYSYYKEFTEGKYKRYTEIAVPVCLGDVYRDFRIVGTTPDMFGKLDYAGGKKYAFAAGRNFTADGFFEGVIGARVARETGLKVGSDFQPSHGVGGHTHDDAFKVVGVLQETNTPIDRALFINMEGFYLLDSHALPDKPLLPPAPEAADHGHDAHAGHEPEAHAGHETHAMDEHEHAEHAQAEHDHAHEKHEAAEHDHAKSEQPATAAADHDHADKDHADKDHAHDHADHAHDHADHDHADHDHEHGHHSHEHRPLPESQREVTAILLLTAAPHDLTVMSIEKSINKGSVGQLVSPIGEITKLFDLFVGPIEMLLLVLTVLIVVVSSIGILVSIYNSMSERRREIAVMRALGAGRGMVMWIVLLESVLLSLGGGLVGWLLGHLLVGGLSPWLSTETGVQIGVFKFAVQELVIIPGLIVLATVAGYLPALVAYRTDVSRALSATP